MNIKDLEEQVKEIDANNKFGRDSSSFTVVRDNPPSGYKFRSPFGLCVINNVQKTTDGMYQICFRAKRSQIVKVINKIKRED